MWSSNSNVFMAVFVVCKPGVLTGRAQFFLLGRAGRQVAISIAQAAGKSRRMEVRKVIEL